MTLDTIIKQPIRKIILTAGLLAALAGIGRAATVTGKATDLNTGAPVQGVLYKFVGATTDSAFTDVNGDINKSLTDGIYEVLVGGKSQYITFDAKSDTLNGSVRRNVSMISKEENGVTMTTTNLLRPWDLAPGQGQKANPTVFNITDPANPDIKNQMIGFSAADSTKQVEYSDFFNSTFGRPYFINGAVNNDGVKIHQSSSFYTLPGVNAQGFVDFSDVYIGSEPDTALMKSKSIHERGHAIGMGHDNSRNGFMNSSGNYLPDSLDVRIVNTAYDYMDAFKNGQTDFYMAQLSDTTIYNGVSGNPLLVNPFQDELKMRFNSENPFRDKVSFEYNLPKSEIVNMGVYDITGRLIKTLENKYETAGRHEITWDGKYTNGNDAANGVYLVRLGTPQGTRTMRTTHLR